MPHQSLWRFTPPRIVAAVVMLLAGLAQTSPALAHASLLRSEPPAGTVLGQAPAAITLTFNEPVAPLVIQLVDPQGVRTPLTQVTSQNMSLVIPLPGGLSRGTHLLSWRAVSTDGHPVGGSFTFSIGERSQGVVAIPESRSDLPVRIATVATKLLLYVGLFVGIGGAFYRAFVAAPRWRPAGRVTIAALIAGTLAAMVSVGLQGLDALAQPLSSIFSGEVWESGLRTPYRSTAQLATWAMIAGLFSTQAARPLAARVSAAIGLIGLGAALAASGHAANADPQWITRASVFVHSVCAAFWIGALVPLAMRLEADGVGALPELARFTRAIPLVLALLIAPGLVLIYVQVDQPASLWTTDYGRVLCGKLALVVLLFGFAAWNRFRLTPQIARGNTGAVRLLVVSIRCEIAIAVTILALVALWRFTPPPRALALAAAEPVFVHFHTEKAMTEFKLAPVRGRQTVTINILNGEYGPLEAKEVALVLYKPEAGIEPLRWPAIRGDGTAWRAENVEVPLPGRWRARVEILVSDFERLELEDAIELPR